MNSKSMLTRVCAVIAFTFGVSVPAVPAAAAPAAVQMPFPCGETWYASTYSGHGPSQNSVDWNLLSDDTGRSVRAGVAGYATVKSFDASGYGNWVEVDAGGGWVYRYAHLSSISITSGPVNATTEIGKVGTTGNSTGSHLHYEQRLNGVVRPATFNGSAISYAYSWPGNAYTSSNCGSISGLLHSVGSGGGQCIDLTSYATGTQLTLFPCYGGVSQQWNHQSNATIRNVGSGSQCIDLNSYATFSPAVLYPCYGGVSQQWTLQPDGTIRSVGSGGTQCLDLTSYATGTPLTLYPCSGVNSQRWTW